MLPNHQHLKLTGVHQPYTLIEFIYTIEYDVQHNIISKINTGNLILKYQNFTLSYSKSRGV